MRTLTRLFQHQLSRGFGLTLLMTLLASFATLAQTPVQLGIYEFTGTDNWTQPTSTRRNASSVVTGITFSPFTLTGAAHNATNNVANSTTWSVAEDLGKYMEFTITANGANTIDLSSISVPVQRSGTGPTSMNVRYALNGNAASFASPVVLTLAPDNTVPTSIAARTADLSSLTGVTAIKFRIYAFGAATGTFRVDNVSVTGVVNSADPTLTATIPAANLLDFSATQSAGGEPQVITLSGVNLDGSAVTVTPPAGYEVRNATDAGTFQPTPLNITYTAPTLASKSIEVRLAAGSPALSVTGTVNIAGGGSAVSPSFNVSGARAAAFTPGNVTVLAAGNGSVALANTGSPLSIREFNASGTEINRLNIPAYGVSPTVQSGTATSEGGLALDVEGKRLLFVGYQSTPRASGSVIATTSLDTPRKVGRATADGIFDAPVSSPTAYDGNNIRHAAGVGNTIYASGTGDPGGVRTGATLDQQVAATYSNVRVVKTINGRLYLNSQSASGGFGIGILSVGNGYPTTTSAEAQVVTSTAAPYDFDISPNGRILYLASDATVGTAIGSGGIQRWDYNDVSESYVWVKTFPTGASGAGGRYFTVDWSGVNPVIYVTSGETVANRLLKITDNGPSDTYANLITAGRIEVVATAPALTWYRGVAFAPQASPAARVNVTTCGSVTSFGGTPVGNGDFGIVNKLSTKSRVLYVSGENLTGNVTVTLPGGAYIKVRDGIGGPTFQLAQSITLTPTNGILAARALEVIADGNNDEAIISQDISISSPGVTTQFVNISFEVRDLSRFYLRNSVVENSSTDLANTSVWTNDITGVAGFSPDNFSEDGQRFIVTKNVTHNGGNWSVSGLNSGVVIRDNKTLTISSASNLTGPVKPEDGSRVIFRNPTPSAIPFSDNDLVGTFEFGATSGTQTIPVSTTYGNLTLSGGGTKTFLGSVFVTRNVTIGAVELNGPASAFEIAFRNNLTLTGQPTYSANWLAQSDIRLTGNAGQFVNFNNFSLTASRWRSIDKSLGSIIFLNGAAGGANARTRFTITFANSNSTFVDNGATITVGGDFELDATSDDRINLTGTLVLNGNSGTQNIRDKDGFNQAIVGSLNNVVVNTSGTAGVSFRPNTGSSTITIKGNLIVNSTSSQASAVFFNNNTYNIRGNYTWLAGNMAAGSAYTIALIGSNFSSIGGQPNIGNLVINKSASNLITATSDLKINGNYSGNDDSFESFGLNMGSNTIEFNGTGTQTITGRLRANKWLISNSSVGGVVVNSSAKRVQVLEELAMATNAKLNITSGFVLRSRPVGSARIAQLPNGATITGNVQVETYIGPIAGWRFISTPVQNITFQNLNTFNNQIGFGGYPNGNPSSFNYDGSVATNGGWVVPTNSTTAISPLNPSRSFFGVTFNDPNKVATWTGPVTIGNGADQVANTSELYDFAPTFNAAGFQGGGWNFRGNPYPSAITWDNTNWVRSSNILGTIYFWEAASQSYRVWNANTNIGTAAHGNVIPAGQAFFVKAVASVDPYELRVSEAAKTNAAHSFYRQGVNALTLGVKRNGAINNDLALIAFDANATLGFDNQFDASKLSNGVLDIAVKPAGQQAMTVSVSNIPTAEERFVVNVSSNATGTHTLVLNNVSYVAENNLRAYLKDNFLGTIEELVANQGIAFEVTSNPASKGDRFEVIFTPQSANGLVTTASTTSLNVYPNPASTNGQVMVNLSGFAGKVVIETSDMSGKVINTQVVEADTFTTAANLVSLPAGVYQIKATANGVSAIQKLVVR